MSLDSRLAKLEAARHIGTPDVVRLIWVACREVVGDSASHESFWSLLPFEWNGHTCRPQGVSEELINDWARHDDMVILLLDPVNCRGERLPFGDWPSDEVITACIDAGLLCEWRNYKPGLLWAAYAKLHGIENLSERILQ